jgi:hypothetical protein
MSWWIVATLPLIARSDAPANRYTYPSPDTVYDTRTKLTWQRDIPSSSFSNAAAIQYCANLQLGSGRWRLPKRAELLTIVDPSTNQPAIDRLAFPNGFPTDASVWQPLGMLHFWTSSPSVAQAGQSWTVDFKWGYTKYLDSTEEHRVRCVR